MPGQLRIGRQALTVLEAVLSAALPEEGCALLLGRGAAAATPQARREWRLERIWPCRNTWQPAAERRRRFAIDPREQLLAQKWARDRGLEVLGTAHSHPGGEPTPSRTDRALCFAPALMVILAPPATPGGPPALAGWWLEDAVDPGPAAESLAVVRPVAWKMED
jgi:proteasome lid subunit RPN8/RPN11